MNWLFIGFFSGTANAWSGWTNPRLQVGTSQTSPYLELKPYRYTQILSGFFARTTHDALCPDIAPVECSEQNIPDHTHEQNLLYLNWTHTLFYSPIKTWQFGFQIPFQFRETEISYHLEDGSSYEPPYAGIHHRDEQLLGLGDPKVILQKVFWKGSWGIMPNISFSIPLGKTEDNPYLSAQESKVHQHIQMGTGTVLPSFGLTLFRDEIHWGMLHSFNQILSVYKNKYDYQPGASAKWSIGYWRRLHLKMLLLAQIQGNHQNPDIWMDLLYSGQDAIAMNLSTLLKIHPKWELGIQLGRNVWIKARNDEEDTLNPDFNWSISITR